MTWRGSRLHLVALAGVWLAGCPGSKATRQQLLDPLTCRNCHGDHYGEWAASMHAYASDDPVFRAMNQRGQRETDGGLGSFCVQCHAPMALHEAATTDGLNLDSLSPQLHGVTCYFCHTVDQVNGTHNDPLHLATDLVMRGEYSDAISNTAHDSAYSTLLDRDQLASAPLCGSCHDIVTTHGASIERTFQEWQASVFAQPNGGLTCSGCHMAQSTFTKPIAQVSGAPPRNYHAHSWPGVDIALAPFSPPDAGDGDAGNSQIQLIQQFLGNTLQSGICVAEDGTNSLRVILDNVGAGHAWPSGSSQDRRAWVEVVAYLDGGVIFQSGVVSDGGAVTALNDPALWLLHDQMFDATGAPVDMFWDASNVTCDQMPALATFNPQDPRFYKTHLIKAYPSVGGFLPAMPDRVTARVLIQPIGIDVLQDLVDSGDLDAGYIQSMPTFAVGRTETLEWTEALAASTGCPLAPCRYIDSVTLGPVTCVTQTALKIEGAATVPAPASTPCIPDGG
jgi:hypothetical protein